MSKHSYGCLVISCSGKLTNHEQYMDLFEPFHTHCIPAEGFSLSLIFKPKNMSFSNNEFLLKSEIFIWQDIGD